MGEGRKEDVPIEVLKEAIAPLEELVKKLCIKNCMLCFGKNGGCVNKALEDLKTEIECREYWKSKWHVKG